MPNTILGEQALTLPVGTTAQRPASPTAGMIRANSTTGYIEYYDTAASQWVGIGAFFAQGGSESQSGSYRVHTYTSGGTFQVVSGSKAIEVLLVAGGGGTGFDVGGGGGAGGLIYTSSYFATVGTYSISIGGGGGSTGSPGAKGSPGGNTTGFGYTAIGGGGGGGYPGSGPGLSGGSGGGAGDQNASGASGTPGQGYPGGNSAGAWGSGGGGGAGGAGANGSTGNMVGGGSPLSYSISGSSANYAGGGYGNADSGPMYSTGYNTGNNFLGTYGYGANGTGSPNTSPYSGNGGIAIVRYLNA